MLLGMIGFYNTSIIGFNARAILPYCQALCKFVPHVQAVDMTSNGKRTPVTGDMINFATGVVDFGEPGTNGQHSFYQLLHQGRVIPCEFIGFCQSQKPFALQSEPVPNHEELMSNFFSQPDALAEGKDTTEKLTEEFLNKEYLVQHKFFPGDRPSLSILMKELTPYSCGQLLALYEYRTIIEGLLWNINSFDSFGLEFSN